MTLKGQKTDQWLPGKGRDIGVVGGPKRSGGAAKAHKESPSGGQYVCKAKQTIIRVTYVQLTVNLTSTTLLCVREWGWGGGVKGHHLVSSLVALRVSH